MLNPEFSSGYGPMNPYTGGQAYFSNNVGPGHNATENAFYRLQDASFGYEQSQIDQGLGYIASDENC